MAGRVRQLLEDYAAQGFRFYAPVIAYSDAERYLPALLAKRGITDKDVPLAIEYLRTLVESVELEVYQDFQADAQDRLRGRDEEDWPVLAAALALGCPLWTEDSDFLGTGVAVWTTRNVEIALRAQQRLFEPHEP